MRLLVISKEGSQFLKLVENGDAGETKLEPEVGFPVFPTATIGKFAPYSGLTAVIADEIGLHFIDTTTGREMRMIMQTGIRDMIFSPRDNFLITCEKFTQGGKNLIILDVKAGKEVQKFEWKKASKEGPRSIKFSPEESFAARLASNTQIEIYQNGRFDEPLVLINANHETLAKKNQTKGKYWFDGFEFIPTDSTKQYSQTQHYYFMAWQNC